MARPPDRGGATAAPFESLFGVVAVGRRQRRPIEARSPVDDEPESDVGSCEAVALDQAHRRSQLARRRVHELAPRRGVVEQLAHGHPVPVGQRALACRRFAASTRSWRRPGPRPGAMPWSPGSRRRCWAAPRRESRGVATRNRSSIAQLAGGVALKASGSSSGAMPQPLSTPRRGSSPPLDSIRRSARRHRRRFPAFL